MNNRGENVEWRDEPRAARVTLAHRVAELEACCGRLEKNLAARMEEAEAYRIRLDRLEQETGLLDEHKRAI